MTIQLADNNKITRALFRLSKSSRELGEKEL